MTPIQDQNYEKKRLAYGRQLKQGKRYTAQEVVLLVMSDTPDDWFFTWELMGSTKYGWLSHATHATLRVLEQEGFVTKSYIGQFVIYTTCIRGIERAEKLKSVETLTF